MAAEITWRVENVNYVAASGGIESAHWRCTAADGENRDSKYGLTQVPDFDVDSMIPYDDVTEANVLDWVWATSEVDKSAVEDSLKESVAAMAAPVRKRGIPWAD